MATPYFTAGQQSVLPPISTSKFPERFGLFTLIVLGESIIGVINGLSELSDAGELTPTSALPAALGLGIGFGLWWVYFDFIARRPPRPTFGTNLGWVYLHLAAVTAITVTGVGVSATIADAVEGTLVDASRHLLAGGVGAALIGLGALETTLLRADDEPTHAVLSPALKVGTGLVVLVLGWVPLGWTTSSLLAVLLVALAGQAVYGTWVWYTRGPAALAGRARAD